MCAKNQPRAPSAARKTNGPNHGVLDVAAVSRADESD
jgi:hypothetical protein